MSDVTLTTERQSLMRNRGGNGRLAAVAADRVCTHCQATYSPVAPNQAFCSKLCQRRAATARKAPPQPKAAKPPQTERAWNNKPAVLPKNPDWDNGPTVYFTDDSLLAALATIRATMPANLQPVAVIRNKRRIDSVQDDEPEYGTCDTCGSTYRWPLRRAGARYCSIGCAGER